MSNRTRLHYVDALRVGAFGVLIFYHASVAFFPHMDWLLHSGETSAVLEGLMDHPRAWRLALLFFVSGMGTAFASGRLALPAFLGERAVRLGLPLLVAMAVVVVPQVWCERVAREGYEGSLPWFWLTRYFTEGRYPTGNITWAHMWFVAYLLAILALGLPVLRAMTLGPLAAASRAFRRVAAGRHLHLLFLVPLGLNLLLSPIFPRQTNALYNDGAWAATWGAWFGLGYLFAHHHGALIGTLVERRWKSARLAAIATAYLGLLSHGTDGPLSIGGYREMTLPFKVLTFALAWMMILTLVGFAARHLDRPNALVAKLNEGVFSFYIVHQTLVVAALFWLLPLRLGIWPTYGLVVAGTAAGCLLFFEVARRLPGPLGMAFGIQKRRVPRPATAAPLDPAAGLPLAAPSDGLGRPA